MPLKESLEGKMLQVNGTRGRPMEEYERLVRNLMPEGRKGTATGGTRKGDCKRRQSSQRNTDPKKQ